MNKNKTQTSTNIINSQKTTSNFTIGFFKERTNTIIALVLSFAVGILFTIMFIDHSIGINYFIFNCALLFSTGYIMHKDDNLDIKKFIFWAIIFLMYSSVFFRLGNIIYTIVSILLLPVLFIFVTIFSSKSSSKNILVSGLIRFFGSVAFADKIFKAIKSLNNKDNSPKKTVLNILVGIVIAIVLLLVVIPLMFSADEIFHKIVVEIIDLTSIAEFLWKSVLSFVIAILFFGFIYIITIKKDVPLMGNKSSNISSIDYKTTLLTIIIIIGSVFTMFAVVQFKYLFVGINGTLPDGFNYTTYARNGYFEQVALITINFLIILTTITLTKSTTGKTNKAINIILTYLNALNLYLMISSMYKMHLYQNAYGFTTLRLLVYILLIYELIMLVTLEVKIIKRNIQFFKHVLYISVAFWAIVSLINIEGLSVDLNIKQFEETGKIDIEYITRQTDVSPQLSYLYTEYHDELNSDEIKDIEDYFFRAIGDESITLGNYEDYWDDYSWLEFNFSKHKSYKEGKKVLQYKQERNN